MCAVAREQRVAHLLLHLVDRALQVGGRGGGEISCHIRRGAEREERRSGARRGAGWRGRMQRSFALKPYFAWFIMAAGEVWLCGAGG